MADTYCRSPRIIPEVKMKDLQKNSPVEKTLPRNKGGHMGEWINACKAGKPEDSKANFHQFRERNKEKLDTYLGHYHGNTNQSDKSKAARGE